MKKTLLLSLIAALLFVITAPASAESYVQGDEEISRTVLWAMTDPPGGWAAPPTSSTATWPQQLATGEECGGWWQEDDYEGTDVELDAIVVDGLLTRGEDYAVVVGWRYIQQPACPVVEPPVVEPPTVAPPATPIPAQPVFTG
jgi:hypothetical protein